MTRGRVRRRSRGIAVNAPDVPANNMHVSECRKEQVRIEMIRHRGKSLHDGVVINASRLTLIAVAIVVSGAIASPQVSANALVVRQEARATVIAGHGHGNSGRISVHSGNGRNNDAEPHCQPWPPTGVEYERQRTNQYSGRLLQEEASRLQNLPEALDVPLVTTGRTPRPTMRSPAAQRCQNGHSRISHTCREIDGLHRRPRQ